jgi:hypothetical protein
MHVREATVERRAAYIQPGELSGPVLSSSTSGILVLITVGSPPAEVDTRLHLVLENV